MGEEVKFTIDDYERAIVRVFNVKGVTVGTGFLVAHGYVLTCAHVVLQAMGIDKDKFIAYPSKPTEVIILDFPVVAPSKKINAEVVSWLPYDSESEDVAGLKLLGETPENVKPILMADITQEHSNDIYFACSFASSGGTRSTDYIYNGSSTGNRLRFTKAQTVGNDTIGQGFSGAPMWNNTRYAVVGMLATAQETKGKAYAISRKSLELFLKELTAYSLDDLLEARLRELEQPQRQHLQSAITSALRYCDPDGTCNGKKTRRERLLLVCGLSNRNWGEFDRLIQFAAFLALEPIGDNLLKELKIWVKLMGYNWEKLKKCAEDAKEKELKDTPFLKLTNHLIIEVIPYEQSPGVRLSIWDAERLSTPLLEKKMLLLEELSSFLDDWLIEESPYPHPTLHIFMRRDWLHLNLSDCMIESSGLTLGSQYKLVMRSHPKLSPTGFQYYKRWQEKWRFVQGKLNQSAKTTFVYVDCKNFNRGSIFYNLRSAEMAVLQNLDSSKVGQVLDFIANRTALPVALWSRRIELSACIESILDCKVGDIPEQILDKRCESLVQKDDEHIGHHLTLLWEDPNILPPHSIQFNQEAWSD
jgi:hypothetical protein